MQWRRDIDAGQEWTKQMPLLWRSRKLECPPLIARPTRRGAAIGLLLTALVSAPTASWAQTPSAKAIIEAAKARGEVGEQADGFLGAVSETVDPSVRAAIDEINAGRAAVYAEAAKRNGVAPEAAGAAAFNVLLQTKLKPGDYYKDADGVWRRK